MRALALAALVLIALPAGARAGSVSVVEETGQVNESRLSFAAAPGEDNAVVVAVAGEDGDRLRLEVTDGTALLQAGAGCSGGGPAGTAVTCTPHKPHAEEINFVGGKIPIGIPGSRWELGFEVDLGDGRNSFDARGFPETADPPPGFLGPAPNRVDMTVRGGGGDDTIFTGGGADIVDPGGGLDSVSTGAGYDQVVATEAPDGPDLYDLGTAAGEVGKVDYSRRRDPVLLNAGQGGAADEADRLLAGVLYVAGGSGDDTLVGGDSRDLLEGNDGNDRVRGTGGNDQVIGGRGEDRLFGGTGRDLLLGDPGGDLLSGGDGRDRLFDSLVRFAPDATVLGPLKGPSGRDAGFGGRGDDEIALGAGADRLDGGSGRNELDCGEGTDTAAANAWDAIRRCERAHFR